MMKMHIATPLVSVIIPCFNVADYIEECLHSVLGQTYLNIEIICVDNNSTDDTYQKLQNLQLQFHQIKLIQEMKPGAPAARNAGLKLAEGEWIQFLDADDILLPDKVKNQILLISATLNSPLLIIGTSRRIRIDGSIFQDTLKETSLWLQLYESKLGNTCANLWKKEILNKIGGWNEQLKSSQEYNLMFEILKLVLPEQVVYDKEVSTVIRERALGAISKTDTVGNYLRFTELRCKIINFIKKNELETFRENSEFLYSSIYERIRVVSFHDTDLSIRLYNETLPKKYIPKSSRFSGKYFLITNRLFGYSAALKLQELFKKLAFVPL